MGFPAGLVSGSMLATATAALLGPAHEGAAAARACRFVMIGILLGAVVTPETLRGIATWPLSIAMLAVSTAVMIVATTAYLRLVHGWDPLSALLGASPGSMAQVVGAVGGVRPDLRGIAIVQVMRVLLITIGLPGGLALFGLAASALAADAPSAGASLGELVGPGGRVDRDGRAGAVDQISRRPDVRRDGGSAVLHGGDFVHVTLPWWLGSSAVVLLGAVAGSRFANTQPAHAAGLLRGGVRLVRGRDRGVGCVRDLVVTFCRSGWPTWSSHSRRARRTR